MQYRLLGRTGLKVSVVGFGGIPIQRVSFADASAIVNRALDLGINFFDTARAYTDSEAKLGEVLKERRREAVIATKSMARTSGAMAADIEKSLKALGVDYIDLYQLHNVKDRAALEQVLGPGGALAALKEAKKDGIVRHIGITGHIKGFLHEALENTEEIETVQFPFNAVETAGAGELFALALQKNAGVIVMKPLAGGALKNAGLALRYVLEHPVSTVIPGMDVLEQVDENAAVGGGPLPLSDEERMLLEEEAGGLGTTFCRRCEYCQPCPQGIDIPMVFLLDGYYTRYDLKEWARDRYRGMRAAAGTCLECGQCEEKCPYGLPIRRMLAEAAARLG
ncbi:MAG: aldo/keto reductase [Peptococcaceae bacterium]|nr:aldo/keto reductase [Peptococcaceae bacterium]